MSLDKLLADVRKLNKEGKYEDVIVMLPEDILKTYNNQELKNQKSTAFLRQATNFEANNDISKAIEASQKAIELNKDNADAYYLLGNLYIKKSEYDKGIAAYEKVIEIDGPDSDAYYGIGYIYDELTNYEKAIEAYKDAIKADINDEYPYNGLAVVYTKIGKFEEAISAINTAIKIDPKYDLLYQNRSLAYSSIGEYQKAIADLETYKELNKTNAYKVKNADKQISDLQKRQKNVTYDKINELVQKIKSVLFFEGNCITHYTSLSASKNMILKNSFFRLSEGAFLNDTSEGRELYNFLEFFIPTHRTHETIDKPFTQKPFIGSFVAEKMHNNLTLWRMYGKENKEEAKGCAITLQKNRLIDKTIQEKSLETRHPFKINNDEFKFFRVAYRRENSEKEFIIPDIETKEEQEKETELNSVMNQLKSKVVEYLKNAEEEKENNKQNKKKSTESLYDIKDVIELLNTIAFLFKSIEYQHEQELRLIVSGAGFEKKGYMYPPLEDYQLPRVYIELTDITSLISKITLGPKIEKADEWASAFYYKLGLDDESKFDENNPKPEILISHLPYK